MQEFLISGGRMLALYGILMIVLGIFLIPESWESYLQNMNARLGLAVAGVAAIVIGFFLAAVGG